MRHSQIVELLDPWFDNVNSFGASISNLLGKMKSEGAVIDERRYNGRQVFVGRENARMTGGFIEDFDVFWHVSPYVEAVAELYLSGLRQKESVV